MRGHDLRDFSSPRLWAGAGPLAMPAPLPAELGMAGVVVPLYPGVYSAMGWLMSDVKHDYIRSKLAGLVAVTADEIAGVFAILQSHAERDLRGEGFTPAR